MPKPEFTAKNILIVGGLLVDDIAISTESIMTGCSNLASSSWWRRN